LTVTGNTWYLLNILISTMISFGSRIIKS